MEVEAKKINNNKKILYTLLIILFFIVVPLLCYVFLFPRFHVKNFLSQTEINYQSTFNNNSGNVCFGNIFHCEKVNVSKQGTVDTSKLGSYTVKYTYSYDGKEIYKDSIVKVVDKEAPDMTIEEEEFTYCPNGKTKEYKVKAIDNYDGDISEKVSKEVRDNKIIFQVTDSSGNTSTITKDATLKDDEKPVIKLQGDSVMYLPLNSTYEEPGALATDNCDDDLTSKIITTGTVDTNKSGEYKITYTVKDSSGNEEKVERSIWVYQNNNYNAPDGKSIYLTFDDGPGPYTNDLLDTLQKYNVKATFFVTDQGLTKGYDNALLRAYKEGHTIGLHSATHNYGYIYSSVDNYFNDLYAIQNKVKNITGFAPMIIRFPGGSSNTISKNYDNGAHIMSELTKAVEARGFRYFDWNVSSGDAGETTNTAKVVSNVINSLGNNNTYVVLQHDIKKFSVDAVESIIQFGLAHGYTFRALTMTSPTVHHHINN